MSLFRKNQGKFGEDAAAMYLQKNGFRILDRNFTIRGGEIDIIAIDQTDPSRQEILAFIEVKTRKSSEFGTPLEAITHWKLRSLIKTAEYYKLTRKNLPDEMRIDAVGITLTDDNTIATIELVKNIS